MNTIDWNDFKKIEIRVGTIIVAEDFPEATKPAYKLKVDLGRSLGIKQSSAQITTLYSKEDLVVKQVMVVVNLEPKQIGPFMSECLITGFHITKEDVVLAGPKQKVENGTLLS